MHQCAHHHSTDHYGRAFAVGVTLNVAFVIVEAGYGWWVNSLALLADAGHNLSDVLGLLLAWGGYALAKVAPSPQRTYGWRGSTILAAVFNSLLLLIAVGGITWEAIGRFFEPAEVTAPVVITVAMMGVVINSVTAMFFMRGRDDDLNIRGAFLHMAADALLSLGVAVAGLVILFTGWNWVDPLTSLMIALVILWATWSLLKESLSLAMQAVPARINITEVQTFLSELPGVVEVHDLHVWAMSTTEVALTAHLVKPDADNEDDLLRRASQQLHDRFDISHSTIQIERNVEAAQCGQAEEGTL
ncbi:MAG: cation diffusion facilitator family transporter [Pirellulales bacterium]|nr:cation diffusion facilitator family transporter [Pirellulales bacterium]